MHTQFPLPADKLTNRHRKIESAKSKKYELRPWKRLFFICDWKGWISVQSYSKPWKVVSRVWRQWKIGNAILEQPENDVKIQISKIITVTREKGFGSWMKMVLCSAWNGKWPSAGFVLSGNLLLRKSSEGKSVNPHSYPYCHECNFIRRTIISRLICHRTVL